MTKIVCHHTLCGYWVADRCTAPSVEIDFDGVCLTQDEDFDDLEELRLMEGELAADDEDEDEEDDEDSFDEWEEDDADEDLDDEADDDWTR